MTAKARTSNDLTESAAAAPPRDRPRRAAHRGGRSAASPGAGAGAAPARTLTVALTGATGSLGRVVLPSLLESEGIARVVALDVVAPELTHERLVFRPIDLTRANAAEELGQVLADEGVEAVVHLAFFSSRVLDPGYAHEVEAIGTGYVLSACVEAGVRRLVMGSSTLVYGASPKNPNFLTEDRALPAAQNRFVADKVEAERQVQRLRQTRPGLRSVILRFGPILGPTSDNPFTRFLGHRVAPMVLGYDPLVQCLHEEDMASAVLCALRSDEVGEYNVVGHGVLPLSKALRLAGATCVPLPIPFTSATLRALDVLGIASVPPSLLEYLRYLWVADGARAEDELGFKPRFSSREALLAFAQSRRRSAA